MSKVVIKVENLYKEYRLGVVNHGTLRHDLASWWANLRGKDDPNSLIGKAINKDQEELKKHFLALNDISFEVKAGEALGIIGRNGAGKSTLLKVLSRVTGPSAGSIKIKGKMASLLEVGTGFHPEMTGRENVYMNGAILGMRRSEIARKMDEIIAFAGLEKFIDTPVKRYSSGMYVRLAFAVAAHLNSDILILDEVLAVGDAEFQKKCLGKMDDVAKNQGRTVLFVSHNMGAVQSLCDSSLVLGSGKKMFHGVTREGISKYLNSNKDEINARLDHKGNGGVVVNKILVLDENDRPVDVMLNGENYKICFYYSIKKGTQVDKNLIVSMSLATEYGNQVGLVHNRMTGDIFNSIKKDGKFVFELNNLSLNQGRYYISYSLLPDGSKTPEYYDILDNAKSISIESGRFYRTAENPPSEFGPLLLSGSWTVVENN